MSKPSPDYTTPALNPSWPHYANVVAANAFMNDDTTDLADAVNNVVTITNPSNTVQWNTGTHGRGLRRTANTAGDTIKYDNLLPTGGVGTVIAIHEVVTPPPTTTRYFLNGPNFQLRYANSVNQVVSRIQSPSNNCTGDTGIQSGEYLKTAGYKIAILSWDADERHFWHNTLPVGGPTYTDGYVGTETNYAPSTSPIANAYLLSEPAGDSAIVATNILGIVTLDKMLTAQEAADVINDPWAWLIDADAANNPPAFDGPDIPNLSGTEGVAIDSLDVSSRFSDADVGDVLTFSQQGSWPARSGGGNWVSSAGVISGTPAAASAGSYTGLKVRASDGTDTVDSNVFSITVNSPAGSPPTITSVSGAAIHGQPLTIAGTNLTGSTVTLSYSTVSVSQTVTAGASSVSIASVDSEDLPYKSLTLAVVTADGTATRAITHTPQAGRAFVVVDVPWADTADSVFEGSPPTAAVDGDQIEWSSPSDLGAEVLVRADGTLRIANDSRRHRFALRIWDESALVWGASTDIIVTAQGYVGGVPTWVGPNIVNPAAVIGVPFSLDAARFTDEENEISGYSLVGDWPSWASISAAGLITGTPTTAGVFPSLSVRATDLDDNTGDSNVFSLFVTPPGGAVSASVTLTGASATAAASPAKGEDGRIRARITIIAYVDLVR